MMKTSSSHYPQWHCTILPCHARCAKWRRLTEKCRTCCCTTRNCIKPLDGTAELLQVLGVMSLQGQRVRKRGHRRVNERQRYTPGRRWDCAQDRVVALLADRLPDKKSCESFAYLQLSSCLDLPTGMHCPSPYPTRIIRNRNKRLQIAL